MKKYILIVLVSLLLITLSLSFLATYARYQKNITVNISDSAGNIICTASKTDEGTSPDGYSYFEITVNNYQGNNISDSNINVNITVSNRNSSNGLYRIDYVDGNSDTGFYSSVTSEDYVFNNDGQHEHYFVVEVDSTTGEGEDIDYQVNVNCTQVSYEEGE